MTDKVSLNTNAAYTPPNNGDPIFDPYIGIGSLNRISVRGLHNVQKKKDVDFHAPQKDGWLFGMSVQGQDKVGPNSLPIVSEDAQGVVGYRKGMFSLLAGVQGYIFGRGDLGQWGWTRNYTAQADVAINNHISTGVMVRSSKSFRGTMDGYDPHDVKVNSPISLAGTSGGYIDNGNIQEGTGTSLSPYVDVEAWGRMRSRVEYSRANPTDWQFGKVHRQEVRVNEDIALDKNKKFVLQAQYSHSMSRPDASNAPEGSRVEATKDKVSVRYPAPINGSTGGDFFSSSTSIFGIGMKWNASETFTVHANYSQRTVEVKASSAIIPKQKWFEFGGSLRF